MPCHRVLLMSTLPCVDNPLVSIHSSPRASGGSLLASNLPWGCLWGRTWAGATELRGHRGRARWEQRVPLISQQAVNCLLRASSQLLP